jgi:hypothetical protein
MSGKELLGLGLVTIAGCAVVLAIVLWRPTGFDRSWNCPPNATPAATVCIKRGDSKWATPDFKLGHRGVETGQYRQVGYWPL